MDDKLNKMLSDYLDNLDFDDMKELNDKLEKFLSEVENGEHERTPLDDARDLLKKAQETDSMAKAAKYAMEAYKVCPDLLEPLLFCVKVEEDPLKKHELLDKGLENEKKRLEKENYFTKNRIGHFYQLFDTRSYIDGLNLKAQLLAYDGKFKQAMNVCKEIIRLNKNDNTGARYILMAIYACLEEEKEMLKLYEKYPEECLEMLFPFFALYYKLGDEKKAKEYLERINKANPHFIEYYKDTIEEDDNIPEGCYARGYASEVLMYFDYYDFLTDTMPYLSYFILKNSKKNKVKV